MRVGLTVILLAVTGLAGCSESSAPGEDECLADDPECGSWEDLASKSGSGGIRGVVIDAAIVPVAGVTVNFTNAPIGVGPATTNEEGLFQFSDIEPGTYFLQFNKAGYNPTQVSVEVEADVTPPVTKVQMLRIPGSEPMAIPMQWDGFMACSWFIVAAFYTGCGVGPQIDDDSRNFDEIDGVPDFIQSELKWEYTQPAGGNVCMRHYASSGLGGDTVGSICGASPQIQKIEYEQIEQTGIGNTRGIERVVWVASWTNEAPTVGLAIDQPFVVYTHLFHNFLPVDGWTFIEDGAPAVPPS